MFEPVSDATGQIVWHLVLLNDAMVELSKYEMHNANTFAATSDINITTQTQASINIQLDSRFRTTPIGDTQTIRTREPKSF